MTMKAIVDADIVAFRCSASREATDLTAVEYLVNSSMEQILSQANATSYEAYLTGRNNFRKLIYPEYKANRKDKERPQFLQDARQILIDRWSAQVCNGYEADDACGMAQDTVNNSTILCSIDKDLDQIPGLHFNWVKSSMYEVSELEGIQSLYRSSLIGDRTDNIIGVQGIGAVKAGHIINHLHDEEEMDSVCRSLYDDEDRYCMNMQCLYIWRTPVL